MADEPATPIEPIPQALGHLINVNVEYKVLVCLGHGCSHAVGPATFLRHVSHPGAPSDQRAAQAGTGQEYIAAFPYD
jgi:hypothetical protein